MKTVENAAAVEPRCLLITVQSVNISQVWIRILTTVKNAEYVGKEDDKILICFKNFTINLLVNPSFFIMNIKPPVSYCELFGLGSQKRVMCLFVP